MESEMKATGRAPTNIAFIKYMGKDERGNALPNGQGKNFPENGSISLTLDSLYSTTTVHFSTDYSEDSFTLDGERHAKEAERVIEAMDIVRSLADLTLRAKIVSTNNFGKSRGLSSSASGAAALAFAASTAAGLRLSERELSVLARKFSGSGSRSVPPGWVEWKQPIFDEAGNLVHDSYAESFLPSDHWAIADVVAITEVPSKEVSTTEAHGRVQQSPYRAARLAAMPRKIEDCKRFIYERNFPSLGRLMEAEAWDLHLLFISSGIRYIRSETLRVMENVERWRREGLEAYYTINTGQDVHVLCHEEDANAVRRKLEQLEGVRDIMIGRPGRGAHLLEEHLF
ncbi:MAG: diphosphomevalonate decarboxylase [Candidatus Peregrinibacteria bacterium Greene0416_19]|nr:MAG: diphosphomevalonate decarboxylase [Candidatus Peregrinibacteria bacterium Greene0416_19]